MHAPRCAHASRFLPAAFTALAFWAGSSGSSTRWPSLCGSIFGLCWRPRSLEEQREFFDREIAPLYASRLVRFLAHRRASLFGLGIPPAQYDKLAADGGGDVVPVLQERTRKLFCDFPIGENYFAWQAANRGYKSDGTGPVPPYLDATHFETVKAAAQTCACPEPVGDGCAGRRASGLKIGLHSA